MQIAWCLDQGLVTVLGLSLAPLFPLHEGACFAKLTVCSSFRSINLTPVVKKHNNQQGIKTKFQSYFRIDSSIGMDKVQLVAAYKIEPLVVAI